MQPALVFAGHFPWLRHHDFVEDDGVLRSQLLRERLQYQARILVCGACQSALSGSSILVARTYHSNRAGSAQR